jgi:RNA-binding protein
MAPTSPSSTPRAVRSLTGKQSRHLRALAHELKPCVQVGKNGWSEGLRAELDAALLAHELIKVRLTGEVPLTVEELVEHVTTGTGGVVVQVLGNTLTIYRRHPNAPKIQLPRPGKALKP